jgi:hypothetical protein
LFDDIAGIVAMDGAIGIFWSNQLTREDYFAVHPDGTPPADSASWTLEVAATGSSIADDHFSMKFASDGRLFVAVKTSFSGAGNTLVGLLVRSAAGTWSPLHHVTSVEHDPTRVLCLLDEVQREVHVFYSPDPGGGIYTKTSDMDTIAFPDPDGIGMPFITSSTTGDVNNPTSTKQNVDPNSGFVVLAASPSDNRYWHNTVDPRPAPEITIIAPADGFRAALGASIDFSGTAVSLTDGFISSSLTWTSSLDGPIGSGGSVSTAGLSEGVHSITASATDSKLATGTATVTVTVAIPAPPVVSIVQPGAGEKFLVAEPVTFVGTALDSVDEDLTASLQWTSDLDGPIGTGGSFVVSSLSLGLHTITAQVTDSAGLSGSDSILIEIQDPAPPTVEITSPADGLTFAFGTPVPFAGTATDAFDGDLTPSLAWISDRDGAIGTGGSVPHSALSVGLHTITAMVTDSHGATDSRTVTVNIEVSP